MAERPESSEALINGLVERSVELAVFGGRRDFLKPGDLGKAIATRIRCISRPLFTGSIA